MSKKAAVDANKPHSPELDTTDTPLDTPKPDPTIGELTFNCGNGLSFDEDAVARAIAELKPDPTIERAQRMYGAWCENQKLEGGLPLRTWDQLRATEQQSWLRAAEAS